MSGASGTRELGRDGDGRLFVAFASSGELCDAFEHELAHGALFVPTMAALPAGRQVKVTLLFKFCDSQLDLEGEVVTALPPEITRAGATPGLSVQVAESLGDLRGRIETRTGVSLPHPESASHHENRCQPRFPARSAVEFAVAGRKFAAETVDVSYNGMLALLSGVDLEEGTDVSIRINHPGSGEQLSIDGRIANQTPCDHGVMAVGVQFMYDLSRVDEVAAFVDDLRGFHHACSLATVTGSVSDVPLETMLQTFSACASAGTLRLIRGDDRGKLVYQEDEILYVSTGLASGAKALGRMFAWTEAQFEFEPRGELVDGDETRLPLLSAILSAAVERDELARLDLGNLDPDATFSIDAERLSAVRSTLDDLGRELVENAAMGFPLGALVDILAASDVRIYKVVAELIAGGVLQDATASSGR